MITHEISVCISTHNNLNYLKLCIESVIKNFYYSKYEINIFAENCTDGTDEWLLEYQSSLVNTNIKFKYIIEHNDVDKGIGYGMNRSADMATGKYIIFLHSDMYVCKDYDKILLEHIDKKMIVSSFRIEPNIWNAPITDDVEFTEVGVMTAKLDIFGEYYNTFKPDIFNQYVDEFKNSNTNNTTYYRKAMGAGGYIISKKDWNFIGGNDEKFAPACYEDMDLFLRMQIENYNFKLIPSAIVFHFGARGSHFTDDNIHKKSQRQIDAEITGAMYWFKKWRSFPQLDEVNFVKVPTIKNY